MKNLIALLIAIMLTGVLVSSIHFGTAQASIPVSGIISVDTTWTKANTPYTVTGSILVSKGVTLTIEAGVTVNDFYVQVSGTLIALGTSTDPVYLNRATIFFTESSKSWNEQDGSGSIIENAVLNLNPYIDVNDTSPKINNNTINGYIQGHKGSPIISNNTFNSINIKDSGVYYAKIVTGSGSPVIANNTFIDVGGYDDFVVINAGGSPVISNNFIKGVKGNGIRADQGYISNNIISDCTGTGIFVAFANSLIERNVVINNYHGIQVGFGVIIRNNTIANNSVGIYSPQPSTILYNNIQDNSDYNVRLNQYATSDLNATFNWWGTTDSQAITQSIYDSKYDFNLGTVNYIPFLTAPNPQAMPDPNAPVPTPQPSSSPSPSTSPASTPLGSDWANIAVPLVVVVVVVAVVAAVFLRKRTNK